MRFFSLFPVSSVVLGGMVSNNWTVNSVNWWWDGGRGEAYTKAHRILTPIWANYWNRMAFDNVILSRKKFSRSIWTTATARFYVFRIWWDRLALFRCSGGRSSKFRGSCLRNFNGIFELLAWFGSCCLVKLPATNCLASLIDASSCASNTNKSSILFHDILDQSLRWKLWTW